MANAKRWISEIHCESQELIDKIICSQSESSDEHENKEIRNRKKIKLAFPASNIFEPLNVPSANLIEECSPSKDEFSKDTKTINTEVHQYTLVKSTMSSPKNMYELEFNSPILKCKSDLSAFDLEHDSPILASTYSDESLSPIITNMEKLKKIQDKIKNSSNIQCEQSSPDLFQSQATQIIEQNFSPDYITQKNSEQLDTLQQIDVISSQDSSSITVINPSSSSNSSSVTDLVQYYHQPNPKKKYKKGGLLHQLKTVISLQTSRISLWHHDIFLKNI
ncbi:hypothetical protein WA026_023585 [Henosepilachna vigintioctopunctata]|uniref:Uncharacterized protein n=1 Tax=Henosepilachna vigintioctopunctata TaxID=420089 RepID=A0AAW1V636_9CUCU